MHKKIFFILCVVVSLFSHSFMHAHAMVYVLDSIVPKPEPYDVKCTYQYVYVTSDPSPYRCYINFSLGHGIWLVPESSLQQGDLGKIAIHADIYGLSHKAPTQPPATNSISRGMTLSNQISPGEPLVNVQKSSKSIKVTKKIPEFTASSQGVKMGIKFEQQEMNPKNVRKLFDRDRRGGNMTLLELQTLVGPGVGADTLEDLKIKLGKNKIAGCEINFPGLKK